MKQVLLPLGAKLDAKHVVTKDIIDYVLKNIKNREILGQVLDHKEIFSGKVNPEKISHIIKNFEYNPITEALEGEIELLTLPYGEQLKLILKRYPKKVSFTPVFSYPKKPKNRFSRMHLTTVNAIVKM